MRHLATINVTINLDASADKFLRGLARAVKAVRRFGKVTGLKPVCHARAFGIKRARRRGIWRDCD